MADATEPSKCYLTTIPGEIRNPIYDIVFAIEREQEVDVLTTSPPSKRLLSTCRQIYDESSGLYHTSFRNFWKETSFVITPYAFKPGDHEAYLEAKESFLQAMASLRDEDLAAVTRLRSDTQGLPTKRILHGNTWVFTDEITPHRTGRLLFWPRLAGLPDSQDRRTAFDMTCSYANVTGWDDVEVEKLAKRTKGEGYLTKVEMIAIVQRHQAWLATWPIPVGASD